MATSPACSEISAGTKRAFARAPAPGGQGTRGESPPRQCIDTTSGQGSNARVCPVPPRYSTVLLEAGADKYKADKDGNTALMVVAEHGYTDCVRLLLEAGADKDMKSWGGGTALRCTVQSIHEV